MVVVRAFEVFVCSLFYHRPCSRPRVGGGPVQSFKVRLAHLLVEFRVILKRSPTVGVGGKSEGVG